MTSKLSRMLLLAVFAAAPLAPAAAHAQPAPPAPEPAMDTLSAQDREMLAAAQQLAIDSGQMIEQWLSTQASTEDRVFSRLYFPIAKTNPQKYSTPWDSLADRDFATPQDKVLGRSPTIQYAIVTDLNAYVPTHNTQFAKPLTGNLEKDYINNRTKRMLGDAASLTAARSEARYLLQRVRLETGDVIYDVSVPVKVKGKHWGCARIGYRRSE